MGSRDGEHVRGRGAECKRHREPQPSFDPTDRAGHEHTPLLQVELAAGRTVRRAVRGSIPHTRGHHDGHPVRDRSVDHLERGRGNVSSAEAVDDQAHRRCGDHGGERLGPGADRHAHELDARQLLDVR